MARHPGGVTRLLTAGDLAAPGGPGIRSGRPL